MSNKDEFTPRLGRVRDLGHESGKRFAKQVRRKVSRLSSRSGAPSFSGARSGRGLGAGRRARFQSQRFAKFRMRRVTVKTHIARARGGIGRAAFGAHLNYIQRDGVQRDGSGGDLYDKERDGLDGLDFVKRSQDDRHQFRIIVSAEDADQLGDLKEPTRAFMARMEKDLGTKLDWVAVDHHNTGHPHTHIVVRGKDRFGKDLIIAREYITHGMRAQARDLVTGHLGPRSDLEIARANAREVEQDRFTGIDRRLQADVQNDAISIAPANSPAERFERSLRLSRLKHLEQLRLARRDGALRWQLSERWSDTLRDMERRGDIIRTLRASGGKEFKGEIAIFQNTDTQRQITGRVVGNTPHDELRDTRALIVDGIDGRRWHVPLEHAEPGALPSDGAIVEVSAALPAPRSSDRLIQRIASLNDGYYSDELHKQIEPHARPQYRLAHKRRLEALRRAGLVSRSEDGIFRIPPDYLDRVSNYEQSKAGAQVEVRSWITLEAQTSLRAVTWLDENVDQGAARTGFGAEIRAAKQKRANYLREKGLSDEAGRLPKKLRARLKADELQRAGQATAASEVRAYVPSHNGTSFQGVYERPVDLAQGRFAVIMNDRQLTLVPWRAELERQLGRTIAVKHTGSSIQWTLVRGRGISR